VGHVLECRNRTQVPAVVHDDGIERDVTVAVGISTHADRMVGRVRLRHARTLLHCIEQRAAARELGERGPVPRSRFMFFPRRLMLVVAWAALAGLAGCVSTRGHLASSTDRLEQNARALARDAGAVPAGPDIVYPTVYARDAVALADGARELRHAAESGSDADMQGAFNRVSRSYHAVRDEVEHSDSLQARNDLQPVTAAYRDVESDLGYPLREARADRNVVPASR
jgi:hypothetical protein